jgi:hypothetical protein
MHVSPHFSPELLHKLKLIRFVPTANMDAQRKLSLGYEIISLLTYAPEPPAKYRIDQGGV